MASRTDQIEMDPPATTRCLYFARAYQSSDSTHIEHSKSSSNSYKNNINLKTDKIKNISNTQRVRDSQTKGEPLAKDSHKVTPSFLRSSFRKVSLFTENKMFKFGNNKCTANFKESECSQQIWSFTYSQMNTKKRDRAEKMTYCRPKRNYIDEHFIMALEDKLKLRSLVKQLAETREREKNTSVWRSYIKELKLKHGMISKHSKRCNKERHLPNANIPNATIEKYYRTQYDPVHANRFDCLLHDVYKNNSTLDTSGVISMDLNKETDSVSEETDQFIQKFRSPQDNKRGYTPISICYPTSSQALILKRTESSMNDYSVHRPRRRSSLKQRGHYHNRCKTRIIYEKPFDDNSYDSDNMNSPNQLGQQSPVTDAMYSNSPRYRGEPIIIKSESRNRNVCYKKCCNRNCGNDECSLNIVRETSNEDRDRRNSLEVQTDGQVMNSKILSAISFYGLADEVKITEGDINTTKLTSCNQQVLENINEKLNLLVKVVLSLTKKASAETKNEINPSAILIKETDKPNNNMNTNSFGIQVEKEDKTARNEDSKQQDNTETITVSNYIYKYDNSNVTQPVCSKNNYDRNKDLSENKNLKSAQIKFQQEPKIQINQTNDVEQIQSFTKKNEGDISTRVSDDVNLLLKHLRRKIDDLHKIQTKILSDHEENCKTRDEELKFSCINLTPNKKPIEDCNRNCVKDLTQLKELLYYDTQKNKNYTQEEKRKKMLLSIMEKVNELERKDDLSQNNQLQDSQPQYSKYKQPEIVCKDIKKMLQELYDMSKTNVISTDKNTPATHETENEDTDYIKKTDTMRSRKDVLDPNHQPCSLSIKEEPLQKNMNKNYPQKALDLSVTKDQSPVNMSLRSTQDSDNSIDSRKQPCKACFVKKRHQQSLKINEVPTYERNKTNCEQRKIIKNRNCKANCNVKYNRDIMQKKEQPSRDSCKISDLLKTFKSRVNKLESHTEMIKNSRLNEILKQSNFPSQIRKELLKSSQNWQNKHNFSKEEEDDRMYYRNKFKERQEEAISSQEIEPCICESDEFPKVVGSPTYSKISKRRESDVVNKEKENKMLPDSGVIIPPQMSEKIMSPSVSDHGLFKNYALSTGDLPIANVIKEKEAKIIKEKEDKIIKEREKKNYNEKKPAEKEECRFSERESIPIPPKVLSYQGLGQFKNYALSQESVLASDKNAIRSPSESSYIRQVLGNSLSKDNENPKVVNKKDQPVVNANGSQSSNNKTKDKTDIEPLLNQDEFLRPDGFKNLTGKPERKSSSNISRKTELDQKPSWFKRCCWNKRRNEKDGQQFHAVLIKNSNQPMQTDYHAILQTKILSFLNEGKPQNKQVEYDEKNINTDPVETFNLPQALGRANTYKKHHTEVIVSIEGKDAKGRRKWNSEKYNSKQSNYRNEK